MDAENGHLIEDADGVSVAVLDDGVDGAGVTSKTTAASREAAAAHGLSPALMDELAELAADKVRDGGLRLMGGWCLRRQGDGPAAGRAGQGRREVPARGMEPGARVAALNAGAGLRLRGARDPSPASVLRVRRLLGCGVESGKRVRAPVGAVTLSVV